LIKKLGVKVVLTGILAASLVGCATSGSVDKKVAQAQAKSDQKIESVETQVESIQEKQKIQDARIEELGRGAAEALKRAEEAGVLAKGKVVLEQTFTEDRIRFKTGSSDLNDEAKKALDEFGTKVKAMDKGIYMEIQGHTDDTGGSKYNDGLGQGRADSVRRYLSRQHSLPLNRMSTISYGDTLPVAPNKTKKGRAQNRRVVVVVLE
jgi:peptidoglycan-associated lipoprotein